jgi:hypothetical protein
MVDESYQKHHMSPLDTRKIAREHGLEMPTLLYRGPFDMDQLIEVTQGKESISGTEINMREGAVAYSHDLTHANRHPRTGVKIVKSISPEYLLRKDGTEYN